MKSWNQLLGFVSAAGIRGASRLSNGELRAIAVEIFGVPYGFIDEMAAAIQELGPSRRKKLCRKYRKSKGLKHPQREAQQRLHAAWAATLPQCTVQSGFVPKSTM